MIFWLVLGILIGGAYSYFLLEKNSKLEEDLKKYKNIDLDEYKEYKQYKLNKEKEINKEYKNWLKQNALNNLNN